MTLFRVRAGFFTGDGVELAGVLLALDWAVGQVAPVPHLPLSWMAATHGVANAVGFGLCGLCGLLAWRRLPAVPVGPGTVHPTGVGRSGRVARRTGPIRGAG